MKKFLLGIVAGIIIAGVTAVVLMFAAVKFGSSKPSVPDKLVLRLTLVEVYSGLKSAARDPRVKAVLLEPRHAGAGWGKLAEIRAGIEAVRKAGKPVYAMLQSPDLRDYYLASAADKVFLSPEDILNVKGLRLEAMYFKGTLDKIGVQVEIEHAGKYKDAGDTFTRTAMTPETKEALNTVLDGLYGDLSDTLAKARGKTREEMTAIIDQGPFLAPQAKSSGLVDELAYSQDARDRLLKQVSLDNEAIVSLREYSAAGLDLGKGARKRIAYLVAQGDILRASGGDLFGDEMVVTPAGIGALIRSIKADDTIAGVIVRIDSPGGDAVASDEILEQLKRLAKEKPLVFSMSDVAASGGYYMAMTGDPVVAYPSTLTGSIGVIYGKVNLQGLYAKLGISVDKLKRGRFADIDSSAGPMTPEARQKLREGVDFTYRGFLSRVAAGRKKKVEEIEPFAQGRVWLGAHAKQNGLLDQVGGLDAAVDLLRDKAGIGATTPVALVVFPRRKTVFEVIFSRAEEAAAAQQSAAAMLLRDVGPGVRPFLMGGMLRALPYRIELH